LCAATEFDLAQQGVNGWHVPHRDQTGRTSAAMIEGESSLEAMVDACVAGIELALSRDSRSRDGEHTRRQR